METQEDLFAGTPPLFAARTRSVVGDQQVLESGTDGS